MIVRTMVACVLLLGASPAAMAGPIVLELFTSQACSSCPPADALLLQLARRPDVLALDMHVDYWDGPGWRDPFSAAAFTRRQQRYAALLGSGSVYTPELVVGGRVGVVGSDPAAVQQAIAAARPEQDVSVSLHRDGETIVIEADAGAGEATVLLVGYDGRHETRVRGGENGGRTLVEANVVRSMQAVGAWHGAKLRLNVAAPAGEHAAVLLQAPDGRILGAG